MPITLAQRLIDRLLTVYDFEDFQIRHTQKTCSRSAQSDSEYGMWDTVTEMFLVMQVAENLAEEMICLNDEELIT